MMKLVGQSPTGERTIEAVAMTGIDRGSTDSQSVSGARARHRDGSRAACLETAYPPRSASAAQMRQALRAYLFEQALDATVVYDVVLAADEAFINAVGHAEAADDLIRVTARVSEGEASVEIQDGGGGFTLRRSEPLFVPDVRRVRGRGVFLMKSLMDEVSVNAGRRGTTVRMVRHLA
jgi:anti-sigma regulatory factor (Ser/Thr protein kinase)